MQEDSAASESERVQMHRVRRPGICQDLVFSEMQHLRCAGDTPDSSHMYSCSRITPARQNLRGLLLITNRMRYCIEAPGNWTHARPHKNHRLASREPGLAKLNGIPHFNNSAAFVARGRALAREAKRNRHAGYGRADPHLDQNEDTAPAH